MTLLTPKKTLLNDELVRPDTYRSVPRDKKLLWLDKNENMDPLQAQFIKSVCDDIDPIVLSTYPEAAEAYFRLSKWLGVPPDCILFVPGSDGAIRMTFESFVEQGETVIYTNPTFAMYPVYSKMFGAVAHEISYHKNASGPEISSSSDSNIFVKKEIITSDVRKTKIPAKTMKPEPNIRAFAYTSLTLKCILAPKF